MKKSDKKLIVPGTGKETANQIQKKSNYSGKTPEEMMRKHIRDKNDVITDEDFYNLNLSTEISDDKAIPELVIPDGKERPKDEDKDPVVITPWDIIG
jgi:hypothetical protein